MQVNGVCLMLAWCLLSFDAMAEDKPSPPGDDLLEFLGQWERVDGQWMDPTEVQELTMLEGKKLNGENDEK